MLSTIHDYAAERLEESADAESARERHAQRFARLAREAAAVVMGTDKKSVLDLIEREHDNLRSAISWAVVTGRAETALRMCADLWRFWQMRGYLYEGRERIEQALAMAHAEDHPDARMAALEAAGGIAYWQGQGDQADRWYEASLELARSMNDRAAEANAHYNLTFSATYAGAGVGDLGRGRAHADQAIAIYEELGDRAGQARALWALANTGWGPTASPVAKENAERALVIFRELGDTFMIGWSRYTIGLYAVQVSDYVTARTSFSESLAIFTAANDVSGYVLVIDSVAALAHRLGDDDVAARLSGAVAELERRTGTLLNAPNRVFVGWTPEILLSDPGTVASWEQGTHLSADEAAELAASWLAGSERLAAERSAGVSGPTGPTPEG
jgi:tetratricopeptide (TPR) repeat protein